MSLFVKWIKCVFVIHKKIKFSRLLTLPLCSLEHASRSLGIQLASSEGCEDPSCESLLSQSTNLSIAKQIKLTRNLWQAETHIRIFEKLYSSSDGQLPS